jgi:hypothetical protein
MKCFLRSLIIFGNRLRLFLAGKKTYAVAFGILVYAIGVQRGWWQNDVAIWGVLGSSTAVTIRVAVARILKQFLDDMTVASATPAPKS